MGNEPVVYINFKYDTEKNLFSIEDTNLNGPGAAITVLSSYLSSIMGSGADNSTPNRRPGYDIRISLDLSDDAFSVESNTGNKGLTAGITMQFLDRLTGRDSTIGGLEKLSY